MILNKKIYLIIFYLTSIFFLLLVLTLKVKSETKIIAGDGDNLLKLSEEYGVPLKELMHKNNFNDAREIVAGEVIILPLKRNKNHYLNYKVSKGDTLYKIAREHNIDLEYILKVNKLNNSTILKPGQVIVIPNGGIHNRVVNQKKNKLVSKKVFYHQTHKIERLSEIASLHGLKKEELITLNKLNKLGDVPPHIKLKVRKTNNLKWLKYGSLIINWSGWSYLDGNYITPAKNKKNKSFYLAINCKKRALNNTLINRNWTNWYFPKSDFEFKFINDFCDKGI